MSKELTEQWKNGTLPFGMYYVKTTYGEIRTDETVYLVGKKRYRWRYTDICCVEEIIAPMPDYDHFVELTENVNQFQQVKLGVELTEKYYSGTLPSGHYYFSNGNSVYPVEYRQVEPFLCANGITVLCEVPSYEEYIKTGTWYTEKSHNELLKKIEKLEEQLKEANELLFDVWDCRESREYNAEKAEEYFKKYGVEK